MMAMHSKSLMFLALVVATHTWAADPPKLKGSKTQSAPKIDLGLPTFNALPKGDELKKAKTPPPEAQRENAPPTDAAVSILGVTHTKPGKGGPVPVTSIGAFGNPLMTDKFSSTVKVKWPAKRTTSIEIVILDQRGQSVMEASGALNFRSTGDETEWHVDWDSSAIRAAGDFQVQVTIGGDTKALFPLKIEAK